MTLDYEWWQTGLRILIAALVITGGAGLFLTISDMLPEPGPGKTRNKKALVIIFIASLVVGVGLYFGLGDLLEPLAEHG